MSRKYVHVCDICGNDIEYITKVKFIGISKPTRKFKVLDCAYDMFDRLRTFEAEKYELCERCYSKIEQTFYKLRNDSYKNEE